MTPIRKLDLDHTLKELNEKVVGAVCTGIEVVDDDAGEPHLDIEFNGHYRIALPLRSIDGMRFWIRNPS